MLKIVIAGGTGALGTLILNNFRNTDTEIIVLTRNRQIRNGNARYVTWDGQSAGVWTQELEGADVIINLAGKSINCRFTPKNKKEILESRVRSTLAIGNAIKQCTTTPKLWINAGGVSIFHTSSGPLTENDRPVIKGFLADVSQKWEEAFNQVETPGTRKVLLRIAAVLQPNQGLLPPLTRLAKWGLGGSIGNGEQYISWIHEADLLRIIEWVIVSDHIQGIIHASCPNPVRNKEFMRALRNVLNVPLGIPHFTWATKFGALVIETEAELILSGTNVISKILDNNGFTFNYSAIEAALTNLIKYGQPNSGIAQE